VKTSYKNAQVYVTCYGFDKNLSSYPRSIVYDGLSYSFVDSGIRCKVKKGSFVSEIFTLSDGIRTFRLRSDDSGNSWVLLGII